MDTFSSSFIKHPLFNISSLHVQERLLIIKDSKPTPYCSFLSSQNPYPTPIPIIIARRSRRMESITTTTAYPPSILATIFQKFDNIIDNFFDPAIHPSVDPKRVLANNFEPVDELPPTECTVIEGTIPNSINGAYIRNGPNPQHLPHGPYHLFEGDGMLHSLLISNGTATFCSRYVRTYRYMVENEVGCPVFPKCFSGFNGLANFIARGALTTARVLSGHFNPANGIGLANTSLAYFGNKLFALDESDLPYEIKLTPNGDIVTVGRHDFNGKLSWSMTAHPKVDTSTGEAFAFRWGIVPPFLTFFRFDSSGSKQPDVPIFSVRRPSFVHDFAITKKYAIFVESQIGLKPMETIMGKGLPFKADVGKISRIGVIPRYAEDESGMKWFEISGFNILHTVNAWDEGENELVLIASNVLSVEHAIEKMELVHSLMEKLHINLKTGTVLRQPITTRNIDFACINQDFIGKKNRFIYGGFRDLCCSEVGNDLVFPKISGVVKLDIGLREEHEQKECTVGWRKFGSGFNVSEPFFVAREPDNPEADEDDGYVVTYVHDENLGESKFIVMDAKSPTLDVVATVKLPGRVPNGFHGLFVRDCDLKKL